MCLLAGLAWPHQLLELRKSYRADLVTSEVELWRKNAGSHECQVSPGAPRVLLHVRRDTARRAADAFQCVVCHECLRQLLCALVADLVIIEVEL